LAIAGADGVRQVIENIAAELDLTMGLLGIQTTEDLSRDLLIAANEDQMGAAAVK
jgi:lactate 2-monooxygenase